MNLKFLEDRYPLNFDLEQVNIVLSQIKALKRYEDGLNIIDTVLIKYQAEKDRSDFDPSRFPALANIRIESVFKGLSELTETAVDPSFDDLFVKGLNDMRDEIQYNLNHQKGLIKYNDLEATSMAAFLYFKASAYERHKVTSGTIKGVLEEEYGYTKSHHNVYIHYRKCFDKSVSALAKDPSKVIEIIKSVLPFLQDFEKAHSLALSEIAELKNVNY
ncbi:MAG: hypothetical protein ABJG47_03495 [Ekhidna sp.]